MFTVWDGLARNEVRRFPAQAGGPRWCARSKRVDRCWSNARAGMRDPRPVTAGRFLQDDSRANFSVGDSCHVVGSERNMFTVWDGLARNEVRWFPVQAGRPREGSGPIGAPDSGDDVSIRRGPSPRAASAIKVGAVPPPPSLASCFLSFSASLSPRLVDTATTRLLLPGLRILISAHMTSTPPAYYSVLALWTPPLLDSSSSFTLPNFWF